MNAFLIILVVLGGILYLGFNLLMQLLILRAKELNVFQRFINTILLWGIPFLYGIFFYWSYRRAKDQIYFENSDRSKSKVFDGTDIALQADSIEQQTGHNPLDVNLYTPSDLDMDFD